MTESSTEVSTEAGTVPAPSPGPEYEDEISGSLAEYRRRRDVLEREILPLATSVDGFAFELQASLHGLSLSRGSYVVLEVEGEGPRLGQITDLRAAAYNAGNVAGRETSLRVTLAQGSGTVLERQGGPFHNARVRRASSAEVGEWFARTRPRRAGLELGELFSAPGVPAVVDSGGLNRHTFMCGQSGSGKTYALGLLLERVLAETQLRVVILDPNSDYVGLSHIRDDADPGMAERYAEVTADVSVWGNGPGADRALRLRFGELDKATQAAVLGLDPIADREEYAVLVDRLRSQADRPLVTEASQLLDSEVPGARQLGLRALNLGVLDFHVWDPTAPSLIAELRDPSARCTVVDLGSLDSLREQRLVTAAVLSTLWDSRLSRTPCLLVMDEAHNICPADPPDPLSGLATDGAVQIAAEGRKYGLYLLVSTQRPNKVHENVVSQCDNLLLMRMNSQADLGDLTRLFSFAPKGLVDGATSFRLGQTLVAGKILPETAYVQMGDRVSREGGADIPTSWAEPRSPR